MNLAYFLALAGTTLYIPWTGLSSRFPAFQCFLGLQTVCASIWLAWPDSDKLASKYAWAPIEALSLLAAVSAGAEIIGAAERWGVRSSIQLMALAVGFSMVIAFWLGGVNRFAVFVTARQATWFWLFLVLAATLLAAALDSVTLDPVLRRHAVLFTVLMGAHAFISPMLKWGGAPTWMSAQMIYRTVAIGCCLAWCLTLSPPNVPQFDSAGPRDET